MPMASGRFLHIAQVHDIINMIQIVDVGSNDFDRKEMVIASEGFQGFEGLSGKLPKHTPNEFGG